MTIPDVGIAAGVKLEIDGESSKKREAANLQARLEHETPRVLKVPFAVTAANITQIATPVNQLDGPAIGRRWNVRRMTGNIANPVGVAAPANVILFLFVDSGSGILRPADFSAMNLLWEFTSLPAVQAWSADQLCIDYPEKLVVVLANSSGGTITVSGQIQVVAEPIGIPERVYVHAE